MAIELTQDAADHVTTMLTKRGHGIGLRLSTKKSGCTGFAYIVDYADEIESDDVTFESLGIKLVLNPTDLVMLDGMKIDYLKSNILNQGFDFINPNVKDVCGCGESFSV